MTHNDLVGYIKGRDWSFDWEGNKFMSYLPPSTLGFSDDFKLYIPKDEKAPDYQQVLDDTIDFVARIYQMESAEILSSMNGSNGENVELSDEGVVEIGVES